MKLIACRHPAPRVGKVGGRGFTLAELLVVIGIIAVITGITAVSFRIVARDARLSGAINTVKASLDNARALAMKNNEIVMVVFRPRLDGSEQYVEISIAKWTGESYPNPGSGTCAPPLIDRFVPIDDAPVRRLPKGVLIAAPRYAEGVDETTLFAQWDVLSYLPAINQQDLLNTSNEAAGALIAVMFAKDGTSITRNSQSDSNRTWVDFNDDRMIQIDSVPEDPFDSSVACYFDQRHEFDEPAITVAPFIAVFDVDEARELFDTSAWTDRDVRLTDLSVYIDENADRLHFNRYTGVVMR